MEEVKAENPEQSSHPTSPSSRKTLTLLAVFIIVIIGFGLLGFSSLGANNKSQGQNPPLTGQLVNTPNQEETEPQLITHPVTRTAQRPVTQFPDLPANITVNEDIITREDIELLYEQLPSNLQKTVTSEQIVEGRISQILIQQEAEKAGLFVTEQELFDYRTAQAEQAGITLKEFDEQIAQSGVSMGYHRDNIRQTILTQKLLNEKIDPSSIEVTHEEIIEWLQQRGINEIADAQTLLFASQEITREKSQLLIQEYLSGLRENATIKHNR